MSDEESQNPFHIACIQSILFVSGRPVSAAEVARSLAVEPDVAQHLLEAVADQFHPGGLQVVRVAGAYQMATRPECAAAVAKFLEPPPQRLSHAALETLALVAYRQPVTLPEIEAVRGVKTDSSVRTLLERGLIEDAGRKEVIGRPILYRTTPEFMLYLGINDLSELPPCEMLDAEMLENKGEQALGAENADKDGCAGDSPPGPELL